MSKEIILIMGYPASGKTVLTKKYEERGYYRINRDELGGSLSDLVKRVERQHVENGESRFVMDQIVNPLNN